MWGIALLRNFSVLVVVTGSMWALSTTRDERVSTSVDQVEFTGQITLPTFGSLQFAAARLGEGSWTYQHHIARR